MIYCEMCQVRCESHQTWLDHLAGRKHRASVFRMKTDRRLDELKDWRAPVDVVIKQEELDPPKVEVREYVPLPQHVAIHNSSNGWSYAAFVVLAICVGWLISGVRAERGDEDPMAWNSWFWTPVWLIAGWCLGSLVTWIKSTIERIIENFNQRITSFEQSITARAVAMENAVAGVGVNIEQQVQQAGLQLQQSVEQKFAEVEQKVSAAVGPSLASAKTGVSIAAMAAMVGAVYYLCRSLFVRHAEKKESLDKLTTSKVFKLFDFLALSVIVPMMLYNGLSFAYDMWKQVKFVASMASTACSGISLLSSLFGGSEKAPVISTDHVDFVQASVQQLTETIDKKLEERKQGKDEMKTSDPAETLLDLDTPVEKVKPFMAELKRQIELLPNPNKFSTSHSAPRLPGDTRGLGYVAAPMSPEPVVPTSAFDALREYWDQTEDLVHLNALKKHCVERPWLLPVAMIALFAVLLLVVKVLHKEKRKSRKLEKSKDKTKKVESKTQQPKKNASKEKKTKVTHKNEGKESHSGCCHVTVGKHICPWFAAGQKIGIDARKVCNIHCGGLKCMHWRECDPPGYPVLTPIPTKSESSECKHQPNQVRCNKCGWVYSALEGAKSKQKRAANRANKAGRPPKAHASYQKPGDDDNSAIWTRDNAGELVRSKRDEKDFIVPSHLPHAGLLNDFMHGTNEAAKQKAAYNLLKSVSKVKKDLDKKHPIGKCSVCKIVGHVGKSCPDKGKYPCFFFLKGKCKLGEKCLFSHKLVVDKNESAVNGKRFKVGNTQSAVGLARVDTRCLNTNLIWGGVVVCEHLFKTEEEKATFQFRHKNELFSFDYQRKQGKKIGHDLLWFPRPESIKDLPALHHKLPVEGMKVSLYAYDSDADFLKSDISHDSGKIIRFEDHVDSMSVTSVSKHKVGIYKLSSVDGNCSGVVIDAESGKVVGFHNATRGGVENIFLAITPQIVAAVTGQPQKN